MSAGETSKGIVLMVLCLVHILERSQFLPDPQFIFCDVKYCTVMVRLYILLQSLSVHCIILLCVIASVVNLKQCLYLNLHNLQYINISTDTKKYRMPEKMPVSIVSYISFC
jgi:hypothetical protein